MIGRRRVAAGAALVAASLAFAPTAKAQPPQPSPQPRPIASGVTPPQVIEHVDAVYPPALLASGADVTVIVTVTVERDGTVSDATIAQSGGEDFDRAALLAIRRWRFAPALKQGTATRARIRVPFHFAPGPHPEPAAQPGQDPSKATSGAGSGPGPGPGTGSGPGTAPEAQDADHATHDVQDPADVGEGVALPHAVAEPGKPLEIHVQGRPNPPRRGGSDFRFDRRTLESAPHPTAADMLNVAPGFYVMHPEGEAVAQRVVLRGFDADHGQDVEFSVGGIPLNQPSHIHGQGYADLNIILPETVRSIRVLEGVYDPKQGDFAVAGGVEFDLGVPERGAMFQASYGAFNTKRFVALWAPEGAAEETFAAAAFRQSDGFGDGTRGAISGALTGQYRLELQSDLTALLHVAAYGARTSIGGVLRRDDIASGRYGFYDTYDDPTARSQSAAASRIQASFTVERAADDGSHVSGMLWAALTNFRTRINFTGFTQRSRVRPAWAGRGDLIEQSNGDTGIGGRFAFRGRRFEPLSWLALQLSLGADARAGSIEQAQNLLQAPQNETWDQRVDATIKTADVGLYGDLFVMATRFARLRAGMRAALLLFDVDDRLGNFIPAFQKETHIQGFRRTAAGIAWGPRATLESDLLPWLRAHAAYGEGYRSPQARQLEEGESAPFTKVRSYEAGVKLYDKTRFSVTVAAYETRLSNDLAFDASEGRLERIGPTTRRGLVAHVDASPVPGFTASASGTFVHATLDSPPPPTPDNPTPPYIEGQELPFVPPLVVRADLGYERAIAEVLGEPLRGRIGYGATFLSSRPLPYSQYAQPVFLLDATLSFRRSFLEIGVDATNLLNAEYADTEYSFVSSWRKTGAPSFLPARHISAGPPLSVLGRVTLYL